MRKVFLNILFLLAALSTFGQGFQRQVGQDFAELIDDVTEVEPGLLRLRFVYSYNGPGANYSKSYYALYDHEKDSLGFVDPYHTAGVFYDKHRNFYDRGTKIIATFQECCSFGGRVGMGFSYLDLKDRWSFNTYWMPYMSGSFSPIWKDDSLLLFRSVDSLHRLEGYTREDLGNNALIRSYYIPHLQVLRPLDTIVFPFDFECPGSIFYHPEQGQYELLYDSLQFFFRAGANQPDSMIINKGDFYWGAQNSNNYIYDQNLRRHAYAAYDSSWYVEDTLNYSFVRFKLSREGDLTWEAWPKKWKYDQCANCELLRYHKQDAGVAVYLMRSLPDSSLYLYRVNNDSIEHSVLLKQLPETMQIRTIYSHADHSFYLGGKVNFIYDTWNSTSEPILVKIDRLGRSSALNPSPGFQVHLNSVNRSIKFFRDGESFRADYRIIDSAGRILQKGQEDSSKEWPLEFWSSGIYYLQVWNGTNYLGQQAFLINR